MNYNYSEYVNLSLLSVFVILWIFLGKNWVSVTVYLKDSHNRLNYLLLCFFPTIQSNKWTKPPVTWNFLHLLEHVKTPYYPNIFEVFPLIFLRREGLSICPFVNTTNAASLFRRNKHAEFLPHLLQIFPGQSIFKIPFDFTHILYTSRTVKCYSVQLFLLYLFTGILYITSTLSNNIYWLSPF